MLVAGAVVVWLACGGFVALRMARRGHSPLLWWLLIFLGPVSALLALDAVDDERRVRSERVELGAAGPGPLHLVVGVDGSAQALRACREAVRAFSDQIGQVTVATVIGFDIPGTDALDEAERHAEEVLGRASAAVTEAGGPVPGRLRLVGQPAHALADWAADNGADAVVVAARSHSRAEHAMVGSVTGALLARSTVPVVVVPAPGP